MDIEKRLERIEKICGTILAIVAHIDNEPIRNALRECKTPDEVRELIYAYKSAVETDTPQEERSE
jgi:hypothetical protein